MHAQGEAYGEDGHGLGGDVLDGEEPLVAGGGNALPGSIGDPLRQEIEQGADGLGGDSASDIQHKPAVAGHGKSAGHRVHDASMRRTLRLTDHHNWSWRGSNRNLPPCPHQGLHGAIADGDEQVLELGLVLGVGECREQLVRGARHGHGGGPVEVGRDGGADEDPDKIGRGVLAPVAAERGEPVRGRVGAGGTRGSGVVGQDDVPGEAADDGGGEAGAGGGEQAVQDPIGEADLCGCGRGRGGGGVGEGAEEAGGEGVGEGGGSGGDGVGGGELGELDEGSGDVVGIGAEEIGEVGTDLGDGVGEGEDGSNAAAMVAVEAVEAVAAGSGGSGGKEEAVAAGGEGRVHRYRWGYLSRRAIAAS